MALQMAYTDSAGNEYAASYWRVVEVNLSQARNGGRITLAGYRNAQARQDGKAHIDVVGFDIGEDIFADYFDTGVLSPQDKNPVERAYAYAKTDPFFGNAEDV